MNDNDDDFDDDDDDDAGTELVSAGGNPLADLFGGGGGMPDLGSLMDGLSSMQGVQQELFEGSAGGGLVRIKANGRMDVESVVIEPGAIDGEADVELLADLVHAALSDLTTKIATAQQQAMGPLGGLLGS